MKRSIAERKPALSEFVSIYSQNTFYHGNFFLFKIMFSIKSIGTRACFSFAPARIGVEALNRGTLCHVVRIHSGGSGRE